MKTGLKLIIGWLLANIFTVTIIILAGSILGCGSGNHNSDSFESYPTKEIIIFTWDDSVSSCTLCDGVCIEYRIEDMYGEYWQPFCIK